MDKKLPFIKASTPIQKATVYTPAQGFNISQQIGPLTPPIIGTPGTVNATGGRDFLSIDVSNDYLPYITQASYLRNHLKVIPMDRTSMYIPKLAGRARFYSTGEGRVMSQTGVPTTTIALIAKTMSVSTTVPRELADDSNIDIFDMLQEHLLDQAVLFEEESFLLGDTATFNGSGSVRSLYDGISTLAEYDSTGSSDPQADNAAQLINAAGQPFSIEHVNTMLTRMKLFGTNPEHILGIISRTDAQAIRGDSTILKQLTNFGPSSVLRTGKIGHLFGVPMVQTNLLDPDYYPSTDDGYFWTFTAWGAESPGDAESAVSLSNVDKGQRQYAPFSRESDAVARTATEREALFVHKDSCLIGDRQQLELNCSPHVALAARSLFLAVHERLAFTGAYRKGLLKVVRLGGTA